MTRQRFRASLLACGMILVAQTALAQKPGGVLQMPDFASPASMSIHEESTVTAVIPTMGVFNNLVVFDQHVPQNSLASVVPDLTTDWSWDEDRTALTFRLRQGVKWHDGKPFTAADIKCTWDALAGKSDEKFRVNPRKSWYRNLDEITTNGDYEVTFHLKRPQPYLIALLASGQSPVSDAVEIGSSRLPVIRVPRHPDAFIGFVFDELERAGADRMGAHVAQGIDPEK
jgi:peptide/nickel transport system substrate-binding protein